MLVRLPPIQYRYTYIQYRIQKPVTSLFKSLDMSLSTNQDVFTFLEFSRSEPVIWNPREKDHKDKKKVHDAWVRISNKMNIPIQDLKKKKEALMATFRQHLKRMKASIASGCGSDDVYKPIWVFYEFMESLLREVYECSSKLNTLTEETAPESCLTEEVSEDRQEEASSDISSLVNAGQKETQEIVFPPQKVRRRSSNPPELEKASKKMNEALNTINTVLASKSKEDTCDIYGKLLASKLKKYFNDFEQQEVMGEIDDLLRKRIREKHYPSNLCSDVSSKGSEIINSPSSSHTQSYFVYLDPSATIEQGKIVTLIPTLTKIPPSTEQKKPILQEAFFTAIDEDTI